jgi:ACS family glucarate transporter-like MFS transporter
MVEGAALAVGGEPIPSGVRRRLLWLIFSLTVLTYLDRLAISAAMPTMAAEFGFTALQKGYIFSAFSLAYAAFEIPGGWLGDRFGARIALTRIVLWWSAFTGLTGAAVGYRSLLLVRFLFGAGEAGAFPNIARAISRWFGAAEQGRALSVSFLGLATGSALTAPLVFTLLDLQPWRWVFYEFGLLGIAWAVIWYRWFRDRPEEHPAVRGSAGRPVAKTDPSTSLAPPSVPWRQLLTSRAMWQISLMYVAYGYGIFFYITWLPTYLIEARGFSSGATKWLASLPWIISLPGYLGGGWLTDWLARRTGSLKIARCGLGMVGYGASALLLVAVALVEANLAAAVLLSLALCSQTLTTSAAWSVCLDVGRQHAGVVTGTMNMVGNFGGALAPVVVGFAVGTLHSWTLPFYGMALVFLFGAVMWARVDPNRPLFPTPYIPPAGCPPAAP